MRKPEKAHPNVVHKNKVYFRLHSSHLNAPAFRLLRPLLRRPAVASGCHLPALHLATNRQLIKVRGLCIQRRAVCFKSSAMEVYTMLRSSLILGSRPVAAVLSKTWWQTFPAIHHNAVLACAAHAVQKFGYRLLHRLILRFMSRSCCDRSP